MGLIYHGTAHGFLKLQMLVGRLISYSGDFVDI